MRKVLLLVILFSLLPMSSQAKEFKEKEFKVRYVVQFNSISLEEASRLEAVFKKKFEDACSVDVLVHEATAWTISSSDSSEIIHYRPYFDTGPLVKD